MEAALALEVVGEILAAVIVAEFDAAGGPGGARAEDAGDGLGDGFVGGEAVAAFADVVAEALRRSRVRGSCTAPASRRRWSRFSRRRWPSARCARRW